MHRAEGAEALTNGAVPGAASAVARWRRSPRCSSSSSLLFPVPLGVWVQGLVLGLLGSLMAVGLGLTYRLNKVVNFAQGDLGTAPAVLAVGLVGLSGVNYFLGLATGLVPRSSCSRRSSRSSSCGASDAPPA